MNKIIHNLYKFPVQPPKLFFNQQALVVKCRQSRISLRNKFTTRYVITVLQTTSTRTEETSTVADTLPVFGCYDLSISTYCTRVECTWTC